MKFDNLPPLFDTLPEDMKETFREKVLCCKNCGCSNATQIVSVLTVIATSLDKIIPEIPIMALMASVSSGYPMTDTFAMGVQDGLDFAKTYVAKFGLEILDEAGKLRKEDKDAHVQDTENNIPTQQ